MSNNQQVGDDIPDGIDKYYKTPYGSSWSLVYSQPYNLTHQWTHNFTPSFAKWVPLGKTGYCQFHDVKDGVSCPTTINELIKSKNNILAGKTEGEIWHRLFVLYDETE